jgi:8-oxo-dGTP pyrophosphatase MutT (NUDIX family)
MSLKTLASTVVYENAWFSVREDQVERPDGSRGIYSIVDRPDISLVIPVENDGFHMVEQYRYSIGSRSWEFPSGSLARGETGTPEELAAAELSEETGFTAGGLTKLGYLHCANGTTGEGVHVFLATDLTAGEPHRETSEQDMCQSWFPRRELERMLREGVITDGPSVAAYLLLNLNA